MFINREKDEEDVEYTHTHTHTHTGIQLSHKKEGNFAICSNMDGGYIAKGLGGHYAK